MVLWGRSVLGRQKVLRKVPPRFHQGCASFVISLVFWGKSVLGRQKVPRKDHVPPRFFKFRGVCGSLRQICLGLSKGSVLKGSVEGSRFHTKVSPRLRKFRDLSGLLGQIRFGLPKGCVEGSPVTSLKC